MACSDSVAPRIQARESPSVFSSWSHDKSTCRGSRTPTTTGVPDARRITSVSSTMYCGVLSSSGAVRLETLPASSRTSRYPASKVRQRR